MDKTYLVLAACIRIQGATRGSDIRSRIKTEGSTNELRLGVIMGQSETIREVSFTLVLLAFFTVVAIPGVWAQSNLSSPRRLRPPIRPAPPGSQLGPFS